MGKQRRKFDTSTESLENQKNLAQGGRKKYTIHDLKLYQPKTKAQAEFFNAYDASDILVQVGAAGTGKTSCAMNLAMEDVLNGKYDKLIVIRNAVAVRDIGFLKGTDEEKQAVYEMPYKQALDEMLRYNNNYDNLKSLNLYEFNLTSFLRGTNFPPNSVILVDEIQNMDMAELSTVITRVNENSKLILCGDSYQTDIGRTNSEKSGFQDMMRILNKMQENKHANVALITYKPEDCVRSKLVRNFLMARHQLKI